MDWLLTLALWLFYAYLISDVFIVAAALAGLVRLEDFGLSWAGVAALLETLGAYALATAASGGVLISWALYNQFRFRGVDRRKSPGALTAHDLARFHGLALPRIIEWQHARRLVIHHEDDGAIRAVEASLVADATPRPPAPSPVPARGRQRLDPSA